jgi:DNA-binding IscR family transcriptional regulator
MHSVHPMDPVPVSRFELSVLTLLVPREGKGFTTPEVAYRFEITTGHARRVLSRLRGRGLLCSWRPNRGGLSHWILPCFWGDELQ